jgi:membrane-associated HD superfamily phosphohydrolase
VIDLEEARRRVREAAARQLGSSAGRGAAPALPDPKLADLVGKWAASLVQPTLTYDLYETRRRMDEAARQVPALYSRVPKGMILVRKGQPLTRDAIREILAIQQASPHGFDATALLGTLIVVVFLTFFLWRYARDYRGEQKVRHLFSSSCPRGPRRHRAALWLIERLVVNLHFPFD